MKKKILSILLTFSMVFSVNPMTTQAETNEETSYCICENVCLEEEMNADCPICGAEDSTVENCSKYTIPVIDESEQLSAPEFNSESEQNSNPKLEQQMKQESEQVSETVPTIIEKIQSMIDALPTVDELENADETTVNMAYDAAQNTSDALEEFYVQVTDSKEQTQITGIEKLTALMEWFNESIAPTDTSTSGLWCEGINYTLDDNGQLTLTGTGTITTPQHSVQGIRSIIIKPGITGIGDFAFYECANLTSITIPDSVISIGDSAFSKCYSLTNITIPNSVTSIGDYAFLYCTSLTSINIPDSVTSIGNQTFDTCTNLTSINIPDSVTSIKDSAFSRCYSLTNITIPNSVTSIGDYTFYYCTSLTGITIPNSVTSIGEFAFYGCESFTSVTIPDSVTFIGHLAFGACTNLATINVDENNYVYSSIDGVLYNKSGSTLITFPKAQSTYTIPNSVTSIEDSAFSHCKSLTSITIPNSVTSIGDDTFYYCTSLTSINIPDSVTSIGDYTFDNCTSLTSITIPDSITSIGKAAFYYCESLIDITIPDSVTFIGERAFSQCYSLTSITIPDNVTSIGDDTFDNCISLTSITIPDSVTSIGNFAFYNCNSITSIAIPDSVTFIGERAFSDCNIKDVYFLGTQTQWNNITGDGKDDLTNKVTCITVTPPNDLVYDGTGKATVITPSNTNIGTITTKYYDQNGEKLEQLPINVGTYTVKIDIEANANHTASSDIEVGQFTISQAQNSFTSALSIDCISYSDNPSTPTAESKFGTPIYSFSTEEDGIYTDISPTKAGNYWVKATVTETDNYTGLEAKKSFTILPKIYNITYLPGNNGIGTVEKGTKIYNIDTTLSSDFFVRVGYIQTGWTTSDGNEKVYDFGEKYTDNKELTLYPSWKDIFKPTGEITIDTNKWTDFLNNITFGLFFKDTKDVTITATDNSREDVSISYLLSNKELTLEELDGEQFTDYNETFSIEPNNEYVIYAKLTDKAGNINYINSDGLVFDNTAPIIEGIENGKTYCSAQTVTVSDKYDVTVTVNDKYITLDNGSFILTPTEGSQTIIVTDKAGNISSEMIVTVNDGHTGGTASCTAKAKCAICGEFYGELNTDNHINLAYIKVIKITASENNYIEYWHCEDCGKYFSDKDGKNVIDLKDILITKLAPKIIEGIGQSIRTNEKKDFTFRSDAAYSDFIRVEVDNKTLSRKNYSVKEGSTIVTLKAEYLATLSIGEHSISIVSNNGTASTTFTVKEATSNPNPTQNSNTNKNHGLPKTGDSNIVWIWMTILFISGVVLISTKIYFKRKLHK